MGAALDSWKPPHWGTVDNHRVQVVHEPPARGEDWFVLCCKPSMELTARYHLWRQGFPASVFFRAPEGLEKLSPKLRPLFPGYIFAQPHESGRWSPMRSTLGVRDIILNGEVPARLAGAVVEAIRARESMDGLIHLNPDPEPVACPWAPGDAIVIERVGNIISGVFAERKAGARCKVILSMLGRRVVAEADLRELRAAE